MNNTIYTTIAALGTTAAIAKYKSIPMTSAAKVVAKAPFIATAYLIKETFGLSKAVLSFFAAGAADCVGEYVFGKRNYDWIVRPGVIGPYNYLWKGNGLISSSLYAFGLSLGTIFNRVVGKIVDITPPLKKMNAVLDRGLDQAIRYSWDNFWSDKPISKTRLHITRSMIKSFGSARAQIYLINYITNRFFQSKKVPPELTEHLHDVVYQVVFAQCVASVMEYLQEKTAAKKAPATSPAAPVKQKTPPKKSTAPCASPRTLARA